jgi:hypothetical protein
MRRALSILLGVVLLLLAPRLAWAVGDDKNEKDCSPKECCISEPKEITAPKPGRVRLGLRLLRIDKIVEQDGYYSGELTLLYRWQPGGLRPDLKPRNGVEVSVALDETKLFAGSCYRETRLIGRFQTWFRLRRFPFDQHHLRLNLEDRTSTDADLVYEPELWPNNISIDTLRELTAWRIPDNPRIDKVHRSSFGFPMEAPHPRLVLIHIPVERYWAFYLTRFFLPLFLLVALAYTIFWISHDDLQSSSAIGITCMLAIIAFQVSQADNLPKVPYLTMADRTYTLCYVLVAIALSFAIAQTYIAKLGNLKLAEEIDRRGRVAYPLLFLFFVVGSFAWGMLQSNDEDADVFVTPPAVAPAGEK